MIFVKFGWNWHSASGEEDFFLFVNNYLPLEKSRTLHLNKFESSTPKDDLWQVWLNWPSVSRNDDFSNSPMYFNYFIIISPWKRVEPFRTNLNPLHPKDALCQVIKLKLVQWFWSRWFLKFVHVFSQFRNYLPLKRADHFIWTILNSFHPRMLCANFGWNWPSSSGEEDENVKRFPQQRRRQQQQRRWQQTTHKFWSEKLT